MRGLIMKLHTLCYLCSTAAGFFCATQKGLAQPQNPSVWAAEPVFLEAFGTNALSLHDCVDIALENNPYLIYAERHLAMVTQEVVIAQSQFGVSFRSEGRVSSGLGGSSDKEQDSSYKVELIRPLQTGHTLSLSGTTLYDSDDEEHETEVELKIRQPLFWREARRSRAGALRTAERECRRQRAFISHTRGEVLYQVAAAYFDLMAVGSRMKLAGDALVRMDNLTAEAAAKLRVGEVTRMDLLRFQTQVTLASNDVAEADFEKAVHSRDLLFAMGLDVDPHVDVTIKALPLDVDTSLLPAGQMLAAALSNRIEVVEVDLRIEEQEQVLQQARDALMPDIDIFLGAGVEGNGASFGESSELSDSFVRIGIETSPYATAGQRARVTQQSIALEQQHRASATAKAEIRREVFQLQTEISRLSRLLHAKENEMLTAKEEMALTMLRYRQSMIGSLDVIHGERQLREVENQIVETRNQLRKAVLSLRKATGTLRSADDLIKEQPAPKPPVDG